MLRGAHKEHGGLDMAEQDDLLASIAATIAEHREGDLAAPTQEHVERWINQSDAAVRLPILREMDHALKRTYFSREGTRKFLAGLFQTQKLVDDDPCAFWKGVKFLDIQGGGASQKEMLALFSNVLKKQCGFEATDCGAAPHAFIYLDDAIFTGNRVGRDLETWIGKDAPADAKVHVITIARHSGGQYYANGKIEDAAKAAGKSIDLTWWRAIELEDRKAHATTSDVLRPVAIPDNEGVKAYVAGMRFPPNVSPSRRSMPHPMRTFLAGPRANRLGSSPHWRRLVIPSHPFLSSR